MAMGHRERVVKALSHEEPDRVPFALGGIHMEKYQELKGHFGVEEEDTFASKRLQTARVHETILQALDIDFRPLVLGSPGNKPIPDELLTPDGEDGFRDQWGVFRRKPPGCLYYDVVESPLAGPIGMSDIVNYPWPNPGDSSRTRGIRDQALAFRQSTDYAVTLGLPSPLVHPAQYVRGFEDFF